MLAVGLLLLPFLQAEPLLKLCKEGFRHDSSLIPTCVSRISRQEIRELTEEERTFVVDAFRRERAIAPRGHWEHILDPPGIYQLIKRLDARLASRRLSLPYWDTSAELRLPHPGDSMLFHPTFLQRRRKRRERKFGPMARPHSRLERRIRATRDDEDKTARRTEAHRTKKLLKAIRRSKYSELLFLLFEMADLVEDQALVCPSSSSYLLCRTNFSLPLSRLSPASRCPSSLPQGICHDSTCIHGICTIVIESKSLLLALPSSSTVPIATSTTVSPVSPQTPISIPELKQIPDSIINDTMEYDIENTTVVDLSTVEEVSSLDSSFLFPFFEDDISRLLTSTDPTTPPATTTTTTPAPTSSTKRPIQNSWYRYRPAKNVKHESKKREKVARRAPDLSDEESGQLMAFRDGRLVVVSSDEAEDVITDPPKRHHYHEHQSHDKSTTAIPWLVTSPFPSVFIPITVIQGVWKGPHRILPAVGATVHSQGLNLPMGYTSTSQGMEVTDSAGIFLVRVPDPDLTGPLVEFSISAWNKKGEQCEQLCLNKRKNAYKPCMKSSVRISSIPDYSDSIQWTKTEAEAISSEWTGSGYYRRRILNRVLFTCPV